MNRWLVVCGGMIWAAAVVGGFLALNVESSTPGPNAAAPERWPGSTGLTRSASVPTLIMFAHPMCSCTVASIEELARLMAHCRSRIDACVVFVRPVGAPAGWERSGLWRQAASIPGVRVAADVGAIEARRFGARTSGQVIVYDPNGALAFRGGITFGRGHQGDNAGLDALMAYALDGRIPARGTPVFGCALFDETSRTDLEKAKP